MSLFIKEIDNLSPPGAKTRRAEIEVVETNLVTEVVR